MRLIDHAPDLGQIISEPPPVVVAMSNDEPPIGNRTTEARPSWLYRPNDRTLYAVSGFYIFGHVVILASLFGHPGLVFAGMAVGLIIPVPALLLLIAVQAFTRPRFSAVAFLVSLTVIIASAAGLIYVAAAASAAV
jgi:hypothetical protein